MKIGEIIRIFRIANDYSTKQLAELLNFTPAYISEIESGKKTPPLETIKRIAKAFNVSTSTFFKIYEFYEENDGDFKKTLIEVLKIYVSE